jgi:replicative superfamily II helicase
LADRVIIVGAKRGNSYVPVSDLKQMCGRGGRRHDGSIATADIIIDESDEEFIIERLESEDGLIVSSTLTDVDDVCFHILPEIVSGSIKDIDSANEWFKRSFSYMQGNSIDIKAVFNALEEFGSVVFDGKWVTATKLGEACSSFYFHPADVLAWKLNFQEIFDSGLEDDDVAPAWALGNVPYSRNIGDLSKNRWVIGSFLDNLPIGLEVMDGSKVNVTLWWNCMGGPPVGPLKNIAMSLRKDFGRIRSLLNVLNMKVAKWDKADFFDTLELRVKLGIDSELVDLCKLQGISKGRARFLYDMGIMNLDDIIEHEENICSDIDEDENFKMVIYNLVKK